ncbi:ATP-binding cassette sub-family C member 2 [Phytophthora ramorum]|uniref:ATP-binding cassette sub-family C member 2 n=1 Tax=Phytophthora ramorum TaxID=164328 RepID=UPI00309F4BED|nr:ATP-binding cassette sub-family C member 2 [Phytophthora ramorum]
MVSLGARRVLEKEDVWPICSSDACEQLRGRFQRVYEPHRRHRLGLSPLAAAYARTFRVELSFVLVSCVLYVFALALQAGYWLMAMMTLSSLVAVCALNYVFFSASRIGANMRSLTMSLVFDKALKLSSAARQDYTTGEVLTLMSVDTERVFLLMIQGPWLLMGPLSFVISVVLIGLLFDFYSALGGAVVLVLVMAISAQQGQRIADFQKKLLKVIDERVKVTSEALQGIRVMKFYAWEESLAQRVEKLRVKEVSLLRKFHMYQVVNTVMLFLTPSFVSGVTLGIYVLIHHTISVVEAFTLVAMVNICRTALNQLPQAVAGISKAKISYARLDAFLTCDEVAAQLPLLAPTAEDEHATPSSKSHLLAGHSEANGSSIGRGCISIRDASFQWPATSQTDVVVVTPAVEESQSDASQSPTTAVKVDPDVSSVGLLYVVGQGLCLRYRPELPLVLKGVDMDVAAGEKRPRAHRHVDISSINVRELRRSLAIIPQDPVLFSGPLRENLDPFHEYSDERLWAVLKQVHMADKLRRWGSGLDFEVAEGGDNLSVGQRQLLCIGRALLKDSQVVVLDEATANVDTATDALIQTTIQETFAAKTVLIIAHRINTILHCDKIAVLDAGRVAEFGCPSDLLAQPQSVFAALAKNSTAK